MSLKVTLDFIESLAQLAHRCELTELEVESDGKKIALKTTKGIIAGSAPAYSAVVTSSSSSSAHEADSSPDAPDAAAESSQAPEKSSGYYQLKSPMVGTFYRAPSPTSPPFADVGQIVTVGQPLCIIEAMKLMNELECDVNGVIRRICIENGQPVEGGQVLFEIEVTS